MDIQTAVNRLENVLHNGCSTCTTMNLCEEEIFTLTNFVKNNLDRVEVTSPELPVVEQKCEACENSKHGFCADHFPF